MTTALNQSKMKKYPHIFPVFFCLFLATTMNAQFMTPPDQVDDFGLEQFINNGTINLKDLNPANFINDKRRRFIEQEWTPSNTWQSLRQERKQFAANCGLPTQRTDEDYNASRGTFDVVSLDSFIYVNNRLRTWNLYDVSNGVRTLDGIIQFVYSSRAVPDTAYAVYITPQFTATTRYAYTFNASNQLTTIQEDENFSGVFLPLSRAQLTYDARGNLTRHLRERPNGSNWQTREDNRYAYNATNQLTDKVRVFVFSTGATDTTKDVYSYDTQNRLVKIINTLDGDTAVFTLSNHNTKKRPRLIDVNNLSSSFPTLVKATLTYQINDSLVANMITQTKGRISDPFVNEGRFIFEYCGDAVATTEVKKELLSCLVFPNPASESLTIKLQEATQSNVDVNIVNTMGQVVLQARNHAVDTPLSIETLPNGLYVLRVQIGDKIGISSFTVLK